MDAKELAALLNGREYGDEMTGDEERAAKAAGLVVVFGYSDDNMELRGAISDEIGCYEGAAEALYFNERYFTHWMPLPPLPQLGEQNEHD